VLPFLFAIPVVAAIVWYTARPKNFRKSHVIGNAIPSLFSAHSNKPKPAPGKPFEPTPPPAPSAYLPLPSASVQPAQPSTSVVQVPGTPMPGSVAPAPIAGAAPYAPAPVVPARPQVPAMTYHARHDKVFGEGCAGQLTLNSGGLVFDCPNDPRDSFQIAIGEIGAIDDNGVRLLSGKKFHFSIRGMNKNGEEAIFNNWLHQVR
jgi:hypothetical protein